jgi:hypothetical protein
MSGPCMASAVVARSMAMHGSRAQYCIKWAGNWRFICLESHHLRLLVGDNAQSRPDLLTSTSIGLMITFII